MRRLTLAGLLAFASLAGARNADVNGYLSGGYGWQLAFPSQTADYLSSSGNRYVESSGPLSGYGFDLHWVQPLADPLSLALSAAYSGGTSEFKATRSSAPGGEETEHASTDDLELSTGLRLYPAGFWHSYDPDTDHNPDGRLLWPSLFVRYDQSSLNEHNATVARSGYFSGFDGSYDYMAQRRALDYRGEIPVSPSLSLHAEYRKDLHYDSSLAGPQVLAASSSGDGTREGVGSGMTIYAHERVPAAAFSPYLPHAGFPGRFRIDISYFQVYSLALGELLSRLYSLDLTYVTESGLGLSLGLDQSELSEGPFEQPGYSVTQSEMTGRAINFGLRWGWGTVRRTLPDDVPGAIPLPDPAAAGPEPTPAATPMPTR